jgi:tetratricopeptide (TPR) repeat protein
VLSEAEFPAITLGEEVIGRAEVIALLTRLYAEKLSQPELARAIVDEAIKRFPGAPEYRLLKAKLLSQTSAEGAIEELEAALDAVRACDRLPEIDAILLYGMQVRRMDFPDPGRIERLIDECRRLAEAGSVEDYRLYQEWAALEAMRNRSDAAVEALRRGIADLPGEPMLAVLLADELIGVDEVEARRMLDSVRQKPGIAPGMVDYLEGRHSSEKENWGKARASFARCLSDPSLSDALRGRAALHLGNCHGAVGAYHDQLVAYREAQQHLEQSFPAQLGEARCLVNLGQLDDAAAAYAGLPPGVASPIELATLLLERVLRKPAVARDWSAFDGALNAILESDPASSEAAILKARGLVSRGKREQASQVLQDAIRLSPNRLELWVAHIDMLVQLSDLQAANEIVQAAQKQHGSSLLLEAAAIPVADRTPEEEASCLSRLESRIPEASPSVQRDVSRRLTRAYLRLGRIEDAIRVWRFLALTLAPTQDHLLQALSLGNAAGDVELLRDVAQRLRDIEGEESDFAKYAETMVEVCGNSDRGQLQKACDSLDALSRRRPDVPDFILARAQLLETLGRTRDATEAYRLAVDRGVRSVAVMRRLMTLLSAERRFVEIEDLQEALVDASMASEQHAALLIESMILSGDSSSAVSLIRDTRQSVDELWKGRLLLAAGRRDEAEASFRRAVQHSPSREEAWLALTALLVKCGRRAEAMLLADDARGHLRTSEALGRLAELVGAMDAAERHYAEAYAAKSSIENALILARFYDRAGKREENIDLLQPLLEGGEFKSRGNRVLARRMLAVALASRDYAHLPRALELLDHNLDESPDPHAEHRQKARLLAIYPFPAHCAEIVDILMRAQFDQPLDANDTLILAQALEKRGESQQADPLWDALPSQPDTTPAILKTCIEHRLGRREVEAATRLLRTLEAKAPDDHDLLLLRSWRHCAADAPQEAAQLIADYVSRNGQGTAEDRMSRSLHGAGILSNLLRRYRGDPGVQSPLLKLAEQIYRDILAETPDAALSYAVLLAETGQGDAAVAVLERASGHVPETQRLAAAIYAIEIGGAEESSAQRIEAWVTALVQTEPTAETAMLLEHLLRIRGEFGRASELNLELLRVMPDNPVVLNNQAWLLTAQGAGKQALPLIERAIEISGPEAYLLDTRAMARADANDVTGAISDLEQALASEESAVLRCHLAFVYLRAGNVPAARFHLRKITEDRSALRRSLPANERKEFDKLIESAEAG